MTLFKLLCFRNNVLVIIFQKVSSSCSASQRQHVYMIYYWTRFPNPSVGLIKSTIIHCTPSRQRNKCLLDATTLRCRGNQLIIRRGWTFWLPLCLFTMKVRPSTKSITIVFRLKKIMHIESYKCFIIKLHLSSRYFKSNVLKDDWFNFYTRVRECSVAGNSPTYNKRNIFMAFTK